MAINPGYFARESLQNFRRNWVMSLGAVITIYLSLLLVGASVLTGFMLNSVIQSFEEKVSIRFFLKDRAESADVQAMQEYIRSDEIVKSVKYISKEEALNQFRAQMKRAGSPDVVEQLGGQNPLPASLDVELQDPRNVETMAEKIKKHDLFPAIADTPDNPDESLRYGQKTVERLFALTRVIRIVEIALIVMLAVVSLIFISNTIRLAIFARRKEIGIMRLVGASNWFIRLPFLMEGLMQGLFGALLAIVTLLSAQALILPELKGALRFLPVAVSTGAVAQLMLVLALMGMLIGLLGSGVALRRYLKV